MKDQNLKMKIKKGDTVIILSGKDGGKKGKVLEVRPDVGKIIVEKVNVVKKHQRPMRNFPGGIIEKTLPIPVSKAMLVCPRCSEPSRVSMKEAGEKKVRTCKSCGEVVDKI
jgi:large subunit ribosomal protein L24